MFGKARDLNDTTHLDGPSIEDFFGDESAAAEVVRVDELHRRVTQVESQINSQFTSLATYAQIAQEQIELARAESKASTERSEQRLTKLIERERADRIDAMDGPNAVVSIGSARSAMDERLDALEQSVAQIKVTLDECFAQQLALADAISTMFSSVAERQPAGLPAPTRPVAPSPSPPSPSPAAPSPPSPSPAAPLPAPVVAPDQREMRPLPAPCVADVIPGLSIHLDIA